MEWVDNQGEEPPWQLGGPRRGRTL